MNVNKAKRILLSIRGLTATEQEALTTFISSYDDMKRHFDAAMHRLDKLTKIEILPDEQWRDVPEYEGLYQVSNLGRVKSFHHGKEYLRTPSINDHGYRVVILYKGGKHKQFRVHVVVALAFIPNPENKPIVNHIDGNKTNNRVDNLEWATYSENLTHAYRTSLMSIRRGLDCPNSKLDADAVRYIREHYIAGDRNFGQEALARKFNVSVSTIYAVISRLRYTDVC